jgi:hypothetical protein
MPLAEVQNLQSVMAYLDQRYPVELKLGLWESARRPNLSPSIPGDELKTLVSQISEQAPCNAGDTGEVPPAFLLSESQIGSFSPLPFDYRSNKT